MEKQVVIFDADDTLWETQPIYKSIIEDFYNVLVQQGFQPSSFHPLFNSINEELLRTFKLSPERLGQAMLATYEAMCEREGVLGQPAIAKELLELAEQVYVREPRPAEGLYTVLSLLSKEFDLFFYSGGGEKTQRNRLEKLELEQYFKASFIVTQKDDATLTSILQAYDLDPRTTWIVGNSPRFEINPGARLGLNCIWMHTNFWRLDLEDVSAGRTFVAFSLTEVPNILNYGTGFGFQGYSLTTGETQEVQSLLPKLSGCKDTWIVGTSPKLDINPVSNFTTNIVWIPTALRSSDIEPFNSRVFVAFSSNGASKIIRQWSNGELDSSKVIWRLHAGTGDGGGSMINE